MGWGHGVSTGPRRGSAVGPQPAARSGGRSPVVPRVVLQHVHPPLVGRRLHRARLTARGIDEGDPDPCRHLEGLMAVPAVGVDGVAVAVAGRHPRPDVALHSAARALQLQLARREGWLPVHAVFMVSARYLSLLCLLLRQLHCQLHLDVVVLVGGQLSVLLVGQRVPLLADQSFCSRPRQPLLRGLDLEAVELSRLFIHRAP